MPVIGKLFKEIELTRFGFNLRTLLKAGIPLDQEIHSLQNLTGVKVYKKFYKKLAQEINRGKTFV